MMRRLGFLLSLIGAVVFSAEPAFASLWMMNSFRFAAPTAATVVWTANGCSSVGAPNPTASHTARAISTAAANRYVIVGVTVEDGLTDFRTSSVTVAGQTTTLLVESITTTSLQHSSLWITDAPVTSGTTADILVTVSEPASWSGACAWAVYDLQSTTPTATNNDFETAAAAMTLNMNTTADGIAVFMGGSAGTDLATPTGYTEEFDNSAVLGEYEGGSFDEDSTAETPRTFTMDFGGTNDNASAAAFLR